MILAGSLRVTETAKGTEEKTLELTVAPLLAVFFCTLCLSLSIYIYIYICLFLARAFPSFSFPSTSPSPSFFLPFPFSFLSFQAITSLSLHPSLPYLASAGSDGIIKLYV
jgi:hypothetical protein